MAPKPQRIVVQKADSRRPAPKGYFVSAYNTLTSTENVSVVRSIAIFGVCPPLYPWAAPYIAFGIGLVLLPNGLRTLD